MTGVFTGFINKGTGNTPINSSDKSAGKKTNGAGNTQKTAKVATGSFDSGNIAKKRRSKNEKKGIDPNQIKTEAITYLNRISCELFRNDTGNNKLEIIRLIKEAKKETKVTIRGSLKGNKQHILERMKKINSKLDTLIEAIVDSETDQLDTNLNPQFLKLFVSNIRKKLSQPLNVASEKTDRAAKDLKSSGKESNNQRFNTDEQGINTDGIELEFYSLGAAKMGSLDAENPTETEELDVEDPTETEELDSEEGKTDYTGPTFGDEIHSEFSDFITYLGTSTPFGFDQGIAQAGLLEFCDKLRGYPRALSSELNSIIEPFREAGVTGDKLEALREKHKKNIQNTQIEDFRVYVEANLDTIKRAINNLPTGGYGAVNVALDITSHRSKALLADLGFDMDSEEQVDFTEEDYNNLKTDLQNIREHSEYINRVLETRNKEELLALLQGGAGKKLLLRFHPDKNPADHEYKAFFDSIFKLIVRAREAV